MLNTRSMRQDLPRLWPGLPEVIGSPVGRLNLVELDRRVAGWLRLGSRERNRRRCWWWQWAYLHFVGPGERPLAVWTIRHKAEQNPLFFIFNGWNTTFVTNVAT